MPHVQAMHTTMFKQCKPKRNCYGHDCNSSSMQKSQLICWVHTHASAEHTAKLLAEVIQTKNVTRCTRSEGCQGPSSMTYMYKSESTANLFYFDRLTRPHLEGQQTHCGVKNHDTETPQNISRISPSF